MTQALGRVPEEVSVDTVRPQIARDGEIRIGHAIKEDRQPHTVEGAAVGPLLGQQLAADESRGFASRGRQSVSVESSKTAAFSTS